MAFESKECATAGEAICPGPPGMGVVSRLGNLPVYEVGSGDRVVIVLFDIYGFSPANTRANCDAFAAAGFRVVMPDFFRGSGKGVDGFTKPSDPGVTRDLQRVVEYVTEGGAQQIALFGFCWGGRQALLAASCQLYSFSACGGCHCSGMGGPDGAYMLEKVKCPVIILQGNNDPDLAPIVDVVIEKSFYSRCVLRKFYDQPHGFAGSRGDRRDPFVAAAARQAIQIGIDFCNNNMVAAKEESECERPAKASKV